MPFPFFKSVNLAIVVFLCNPTAKSLAFKDFAQAEQNWQEQDDLILVKVISSLALFSDY